MTDTISSANPELRSYVIEGFDPAEMCALMGAYLAELKDSVLNPDNEVSDFERIGNEIYDAFKVLTETHKIVREVRDAFNAMVKTAHECDLFSKDQVDVILTRESNTGAGRKPMTAAEKMAAARKRLAEKD